MMFSLQNAIDQANHVCFMTGAGVSTASGIPDFRSPTGIYSQHPEYSLSADNLRDHPAAFHDFMIHHMYYPQAQPNIIHRQMAAITNRKGTVVTQNIDGLDRQAGTKHLVEFHGNEYDLYCTQCGQPFTLAEYQQSYIHQTDHGLIRPRIVLYGEPIDEQVVQAAIQAITAADLIVVVGTSLAVYPFAGLIQYAGANAVIAAVNRTPLPLPAGGHMIIGDATEVFAALQ